MLHVVLVTKSDAGALGDLGAFINVSEHNSVPCFYSGEISTRFYGTSREWPSFTVSLARRGSLAIESEYHNLNKSPFFFVGAVNFLKAIRVLVACPTLTEARLHPDAASWEENNVTPWSEDLLSEVFTLLRSSPSLTCFQFIFFRTLHYALYCKHMQTLVCENPRLETLWVTAGRPNFVAFAKAIAVCLSRNTVLKSFTLSIPPTEYKLNQESLEMLLSPFTSSSPSEANANLKELALYFQYLDGYCVDAIANLVCRNTTLKKLDLRFSRFWSGLEDGKSSWREFYRALEVNQTLEELSCPCEIAELRELLVPVVPDRYGRQPNTTLSTLRLSVSKEVHGRWLEVQMNKILVVVLRDLAFALQSNTTFKHVQFEFKSVEYGNYQQDGVKYITDKNLWQEKSRIQEILRMMIDNELRENTSLESLAVGHWSLLRVGTEWQTCYRGPCLRGQKEYNVKVKITP
ncbi:hypothetical protein KC19_6G199400 [Ceratodon purpureus]|uniref:Uncharacterized protein n=1 Tax=Ceratodon purpureus TaxID=3225 RepID=A0A8T0HJH8_CERPU|nr:hypothetical protein KC19_6G199400 [Ceratodon purpureus]